MYRTMITNRQGRTFSYYRPERRQQIECRARVRADDVERSHSSKSARGPDSAASWSPIGR